MSFPGRITTILFSLLYAGIASADWALDTDASHLSFVSIKNGAIVEAHTFHALSGKVTETGDASVSIGLASVDTTIPIRDERMREMLFDVAQFPMASFVAKVPVGAVTALGVGESMQTELKGTLSIHGQSAELSVPVTVLRAGETAFNVSTDKPVMVNASGFDLVKGVESLREIAGLQSITPVVPVSFSLMFR